MKKLGINTLVYKQDLDKGVLQSNLLPIIKKYTDLVEIRREYISSSQEFMALRDIARQKNIQLYYSVPDKITINHQLNSKFIQYLQEAHNMLCTHIKFNIGDLPTCSQNILLEIDRLSKQYQIAITIENDQTIENGTLNYVFNTLNYLQKNNSSIGYTFDIGNWCWQKENPQEAFAQLQQFISVIHLKTVDNLLMPYTTFLHKGCLNWQNMLLSINDNIPIFLEYPIEQCNLAQEITTVTKYL